jgi:hypothetical protein
MRSIFIHAIVIVVLAAGCVLPAGAQGGAAKDNILRQKELRQQKLKELKAQQQKMLPLPAPAVERFLQMSPAEQERALSQLTPERRQQVEERLSKLQQLPPDQMQRLQDVYPAFMNLRPVRRQAVRLEIQQLRQMRPALRKDRLTSGARDFSPEEMDILRRVTGIPE